MFTPSEPNSDRLLRVHAVGAESAEKPPFECSQQSLVTLQNLDLNLQSSAGEQVEGANEPLQEFSLVMQQKPSLLTGESDSPKSLVDG